MAVPALTLTNLKAPLAKASGKPPAKSVAALWDQINGLPEAQAVTFDPKFYLKQYPEIAAAGVDSARHYVEFGRWEGRLPFAGAIAWAPTHEEMIHAPWPIVLMPDVYVPAGRAEAVVTVQVNRRLDGTPCERSFFVGCSPVNGGDPANGGHLGYGDFAWLDETDRMILPCQGSRLQVRIKVKTTASGWFKFRVESKNGWSKECRVYLNTAPPKGYAYPEYVEPPKPIMPPDLSRPTWSTDFLDDAIIRAGQVGQYGINGMLGRFAPLGSKRVSGAAIDCYPLVVDDAGVTVRAFHTVNCRDDQMLGDDGWRYDYACAAYKFPLFPRYVTGWIDAVYPGFVGMDNSLWGILPSGQWPPELDLIEKWPGAETTNFHGIGNATQTFHRPPSERRRRTIWQRTKSKRFLLWYDDLDGRGPQLAVDCPDYALEWRMDINITPEGPGSSASGPMNAGLDYGTNRILGYGAGYLA